MENRELMCTDIVIKLCTYETSRARLEHSYTIMLEGKCCTARVNDKLVGKVSVTVAA